MTLAISGDGTKCSKVGENLNSHVICLCLEILFDEQIFLPVGAKEVSRILPVSITCDKETLDSLRFQGYRITTFLKLLTK